MTTNDKLREAIEWARRHASNGNRHLQALADAAESTLAGPVMPEVLGDDVKKAMRGAFEDSYRRKDFISAIYTALRNHLLNQPPRTKTIQVWHVEWSDGDIPHIDDPYLSRDEAERGARLRREEGRGQCVRVTGPHLQEVLT